MGKGDLVIAPGVFNAISAMLVEQAGFSAAGVRWLNPNISYYVSLGRRPKAFLDGVKAAFAAWDNASSAFSASFF
jgi:hypothetical protein